MSTKGSRTVRRVGVVINYLSIALLLVSFAVGRGRGWSGLLVAVISISLVAAIASFVTVHVRTHLWKLVHASIQKLDERQIQVTRQSLRLSYAVFSITCLVILLYIALAEPRGCGHFGVLLPGALIYLAHTLPSSVLAWTEKHV